VYPCASVCQCNGARASVSVTVRERLSVYPCASVCQCNSEVQTEIPELFPGSHVTRDNARRKHGRDSNPVILLKVA
jgi:hypothetical protein